MNTASEAIRKLMTAHFRGDEAAFRSAAREIVEKERRLNHHVFATELEQLLSETNGHPASHRSGFTALGNGNGNLPRDKERNALLIDLTEPRREPDELVLAKPVRESLERIVTERRGGELLGSFGLRPSGKVLFCGPPGCGKSVAAEVLAHQLYLPLATVRFDAVVSSYLGETAANLRKVFEFGRSRPLVLLFDEFDAIGKERDAADEHGELKRVVNSFLQMLDSFHAESLVIAATNHQGMLDPALWRRFDEIVLFPRPTRQEIKEQLIRLFRQLPLDRPGMLEEAAQGLEGFSHADVERVAFDTLKQTVLKGEDSVSTETLKSAVARQRDRLAVTDPSIDTTPSLAAKPRRRGTRKP